MNTLMMLEMADRDARRKAEAAHRVADEMAGTDKHGTLEHLDACVAAIEAAEKHAEARLSLVRHRVQMARDLRQSLAKDQA